MSNSSVERELIPEKLKSRLPQSYTHLPVTLIGRLARDIRFGNEGLGEILLMEALKRSLDASGSVGSMAVIVDPIDEKAFTFYQKYGFVLLPDSRKMFLPMKTISKLLLKESFKDFGSAF